MKILIVCSGHSKKQFIREQADAVGSVGLSLEYYQISKRGLTGYLKCREGMMEKIAAFNPDLIHAHYGFSGLLANLQRVVPVVTTYHGSDINKPSARLFSIFSILLSAFNIFVSHGLYLKVRPFVKNKYEIMPCGVNVGMFSPIEKSDARKQMNLSPDRKYALFSGSFSTPVKNYKLAAESVSLLNGKVQIIELKGYARQQVSLLMSACDMVLMTSLSEGSPQVIKEAMACNCPIVSTDVGDVKETISGIEGCYLSASEPADVADKIRKALNFSEVNGRTNGRRRIVDLGLDSRTVAGKIIEIYKMLVNKK